MNAIKPRQRFAKEFKLEAVRLAENSDRSKRQIANELGISEALLYQWCRRYKQEQGEAFKQECRPQSLEEENRRLRIENQRLKEDKEILKKAAAYFAKESR